MAEDINKKIKIQQDAVGEERQPLNKVMQVPDGKGGLRDLKVSSDKNAGDYVHLKFTKEGHKEAFAINGDIARQSLKALTQGTITTEQATSLLDSSTGKGYNFDVIWMASLGPKKPDMLDVFANSQEHLSKDMAGGTFIYTITQLVMSQVYDPAYTAISPTVRTVNAFITDTIMWQRT
jgi:hypothetical protein